jgi:DNA repair protein RAD50
MSKIKSLSLRGIRSFDPDSEQEIKFYTPLTLIVGKNGCGKTVIAFISSQTVIEALKYATTGVMPLNTKGGAFVTDPKVYGQPTSKAQVKLVIRNIKGFFKLTHFHRNDDADCSIHGSLSKER